SPSQPGIRDNVAIAECEESFTAVVNQDAKGNRLIAQSKMLTRSVLQQGETKDQPRSPQNQQKNQRQGSEVAEEIFPPGLALNTACEFSPGNPRAPVKPGSNAKAAAHA